MAYFVADEPRPEPCRYCRERIGTRPYYLLRGDDDRPSGELAHLVCHEDAQAREPITMPRGSDY